MTAHLGDMLRHSLDHGEDQEISLADELTVVEDYLAIQKIRFTDNLEVETNVDPQALSARVPNLILQPLVENAIQHGLADRPSSGRIVLRAVRVDSTLELSVSDNGVGLPDGWKMNGRGVGLNNTIERIETLYGDRARLAIENHNGGGVTVRMILPWQIHAATD